MQQRSDALDGADVPVRTSALDRPIDLSSISWYAIGWAAVFVLAAILRLVEISTWPLSANEASIASEALAVVRGETVSPDAAAHPMAAGLTALALFFFGTSDGIARLAPVVLGVASLALILRLRHWIGRDVALAAGIVAAISPTLVYASRWLDAGGVLITGSLLLVALLLQYVERPSAGLAAAAGVAAAVPLLGDPIGWLVTPLIVVLVVAFAPRDRMRPRDLPLAVVGLLASMLVISTALLTRPGGFADFLQQSLGTLWRDHLGTLGAQWYLAGFQVVTGEPLALALVVVALVVALRSGLQVGGLRTMLAIWAVGAFVLATLLGGKDPAVYTLTAVPLVLLAGSGLAWFVSRVRWHRLGDRVGMLVLISLLLTIFAGLSTLGLLLDGPGSKAFIWAFKFALVGICIFAPLLALTIWLSRRYAEPVVPMAMMIASLALAGVSLHTSALFGSTTAVRPGEILTIGNTAPAVGEIIGRVQRVSLDMTTYVADARDPEGGHGFTVAIDQSIQQPFRWYFRDFPNVTIVSLDAGLASGAVPDVVIARSDHTSLIPSDTSRVNHEFPLRSTAPAVYADPSFGGLARSAFSPDGLRRFLGFLIDRQVTSAPAPGHFTMSLRKDIGTRLYGTTPPQVP